MIFQINKITSRIDKIYEVPLVFLENTQTATDFGDHLFPLWFRPVYTRCDGVKDHFLILFNKFKKLSKVKQRFLIDTYRNSRDISMICNSGTILYPGIDKFDKKIQKPLNDLFHFLFDNTISTKIFKKQTKMHINDHYIKFQEHNNINVCPFCGVESYTLPAFRRAEYDHFLPISIYPWLGVNFNNLVPMGDICNGKKKSENVLYADYKLKKRREVWYPYEWINHSIKLICIKKPTIKDLKGVWDIDITATSQKNQEKINTWIQIFDIKLLYSEQISNYHKRFIEDFAHKNNLKGQKLTITKLILELKKYRNYGIGDLKLEPLALLKFIWAGYYINTTDKSQLSILTYSIATLGVRVNPKALNVLL